MMVEAMVEAWLTRCIHDEAGLRRWLDGPVPAGLTSLSLWDARLTDAGVAAVATHPAMASLRVLDLSWNLIGPAGARALAEGLPQLRSLRLYHNDLGEAGAAAVAKAPWSLESLNLCGNGIGPAGMSRLATSRTLRGLRVLHLGKVGLGDRGVDALMRGEWPELLELNVRNNDITGDGAARLTGGALPALERLGLDDNPIDDQGLRRLARGHGFGQLRWLNLGGTELGAGAAEALRGARCSALGELRVQGTEADHERLAALLPGCTLVY